MSWEKFIFYYFKYLGSTSSVEQAIMYNGSG